MYLYKYREFSKNHLQALSNNKIWFAVGKTYNDPFDCKPPLVLTDTQSMIDFIRTHTSFGNNFDNSNLVKFANEQIRTNLNKQSEDKELSPLLDIANIIKAAIQQSFLCCFSKSPRSPLMWSHYSNSHTGFCVRYSLDKLLESIPIRKHAEVNYNNESYNILDAISKDFNCGQDIIEKILFQKSKDWKYEKEYRLILKKESSSKDPPVSGLLSPQLI